MGEEGVAGSVTHFRDNSRYNAVTDHGGRQAG